MIPASYLYKDIYRQTWLDPDLECAKARLNCSGGDGHPIRNILAAFLSRAAEYLRRPQHVSLASDPC